MKAVILMVTLYYSCRIQINACQGMTHIGQSPGEVPSMALPLSFPHGVMDNVAFLTSVCDDMRGVLPDREAHLSLVQSFHRGLFMYCSHD